MDSQAAEQIERLFHTTESRVWDLLEPEQTASSDSLVIHDKDGTVVAYAYPAAGDAAAL